MEVILKSEKCVYCYKEVNEVFIPDCNHKVCIKCLPKLLLCKERFLHYYSSKEADIKCPMCKFGSFKISRKEILLHFSKLENSRESECEEHKLIENVFCLQCKESMCQICFDDHKKSFKLSKHQMTLKPSEFIKNCIQHQNKFYLQCLDCKIPICAECAYEKHKDHKSEKIKEYYTKRKEEFLENTILPYETIDKITSTIDKVDKELFESIQRESTLLVDKIQNLIELLTITKDKIMFKSKKLIDEAKLTNQIMKISYTDLFNQLENLDSEDYLNINLLSKLPQESEIKKYLIKIDDSFVREIGNIKDIIESQLNVEEIRIFKTVSSDDVAYQEIEELNTLTGHSKPIWSLLKLDGRRFASGSEDNTIKIWDSQSWNCIKTLEGHSDWILSLIKLDDQSFASSSGDKTIKIWNSENWTCIKTLTGHSQAVWSLLKLDDNLLASGSEDKKIKIWNSQSWTCIKTLEEHSGYVYALTKLNNGIFASGSKDKTIKIWNFQNWTCFATLTGHSETVFSLIKLDDEIFASSSLDKTIKIWCSQSWSCIKTLEGHSNQVYGLLKLEDNILVSGSNDKRIKIWDYETGDCITTLTGHSGSIISVIKLDNGEFASASGDKTIKIWG